jgi:RNA polymerase sigma-54 factor
MAIELKQQLKLSQQLVMTPQLQQAIKLLQLNQLELVNLVQQELQENPVLEESDIEEETQAEREDATEEDFSSEDRAGDEAAALNEAERAPEAPFEEPLPSTETPANEDTSPTDAEKIADVEWEQYLDSHPMTGLEHSGVAGEDDRPSLEATYTRRPSLGEHLEWQLQVTDLDEASQEIARWIIGNIDERGFLRSSVEEIAGQAGFEVSSVERVLGVIQQLDPTGVAARDLRECLLLQIDTLGIGDELVRTLVSDHVDMLQKRDFRGLSRATGSTLQEVADAARVIGGLEPRPGRGFGGEDPVYITPDIYVYKVGEDFHVLLNEDGLPKLKINSMYRDVLSPAVGGESRRGELDEKETKNYVHDKVRSAMWLIKSIHQRQRTIYKVIQSIIRFQREFFEHGVAYLKPLNLRDVAEDIEMHESTVSRVTTNKYVHTPQGIFELKYFFNSSIGRSDGGEALASESVKEKIRKIIENEDSTRPMSDQRIAEMLKSAKIDIARRTVTKYREAMNILSSTKRRQVV